MIQDMNTPEINEKKGEMASKMGKLDKHMKGEKKYQFKKANDPVPKDEQKKVFFSKQK